MGAATRRRQPRALGRLQSFGTVTLDGATRALTVRLHGPDGAERFAVTQPPPAR